ncbi:MAG: hypothetical protein ACKVJL_04250 [Dehalococcoidia bacterium]
MYSETIEERIRFTAHLSIIRATSQERPLSLNLETFTNKWSTLMTELSA